VSSFLVSTQTVDAILSSLVIDREGTRRRCFPSYADLPYGDSLDKLGADMINLNGAAMVARYGHDDGANDIAQMYHYAGSPSRVPVPVALKQLDCLLYQCSEGEEIEGRPLFKQLEALQDSLRYTILQAVPAYAAAPWGM
jgi:hypothetical protein